MSDESLDGTVYTQVKEQTILKCKVVEIDIMTLKGMYTVMQLIGGSWNTVKFSTVLKFYSNFHLLAALLYMPSYVMMSTTTQLGYYAPLLIIHWPITSMRYLLLYCCFCCAFWFSRYKLSYDYA